MKQGLNAKPLKLVHTVGLHVFCLSRMAARRTDMLE